MSENVLYIAEHILTGGTAIVAALYVDRVFGKKISKTAIELTQAIMLAYGIVYGGVFVFVYVLANILPSFIPY